jgi:tetratricopeptide (TPR) repeat protein
LRKFFAGTCVAVFFVEVSKQRESQKMQDNELRPESRPEPKLKLPPIPTEADLKKPRKPKLELASLLVNAETLINHGEGSTASVLCMQALALDSKHPESLKKMARVLKSANRNNELVRVQEELAAVEPGFHSFVDLAHCYYHQGKDELALDTYFQALNYPTETSDLLFEVYKNIGNIFVKSSDFDAAEEFYNKAHTINPLSDILFVNFGTLEIQRNDLNSALERFRSALSVNPKNDKAWVGLALVHNQMGDHVLALANLENALDVNPKNKTAVHLLANWSVRDQKPDAAISSLENYLGLVDFDEEMSLVLIHLFCLSGRIDLALFEIERFLLWNPGHQEVADLEQKIKRNEGIF